MVPQPSQAARSRVSPSGIRSVAGLPHRRQYPPGAPWLTGSGNQKARITANEPQVCTRSRYADRGGISTHALTTAPCTFTVDVVSEEWRQVADRVRTWGRWGREDQLGTLNHITERKVSDASRLIRRGQIFSLCIPLDADGPQGSHGIRRNPVHLMALDGGDEDLAAQLSGWGGKMERELESSYSRGPMRFNDDYIIMALQASTQWDALAHVYYDGLLYNGVPAAAVTSRGATRNSIDQVAARGGITGRGVLLDVARFRGLDHLPASTAIAPAELDACAAAQGVEVRPGDIVLIRTGWWPAFAEIRNGTRWLMGSPGLSWRCVEWLHDRQVAAVAADNQSVEVMPPEDGIFLLFHMLAIRDLGMMLGEIWDLEELGADCARDGVYEFFLGAAALQVTGGVGTPVNPIAIK